MIKIFIDCETNGLPLNYNAEYTNVENFPRVVSLSYIIEEDEKIVKIFNSIIKADDFFISDDTTKIHGITMRTSLQFGLDKKNVYREFAEDLNKANYIIAHNIDFDLPILRCEMFRNNMHVNIENKITICTMKDTADILKIPNTEKKYNSNYKFPKLQELYFYLFNKNFDGAHNSLNDIQATYECYKRLQFLEILE